MDERKRGVIFANGEIKDPQSARSLVQKDDLLVAADGGLKHLQAMGLQPHLLIGDLDSVTPQDVEGLQTAGVEIRRFPVEKNETDLELALLAVVAAGCTVVRVVGALGGRLDQTLGNLFLLMLPQLAEVDVRLDDGQEEVFLILAQALLAGKAGDVVSLLPLNGPAYGVATDGLVYPLRSEPLFPEHTRGISNVMVDAQASIQVDTGILLCIHTRY